MSKITSDTSNTNPFGTVPESLYSAFVRECRYGKSNLKEDGTGGNPMLTFGFTIANHGVAPQYNGRQINFYNVVVKGLDKNRKPVNINRIIEMIVATGIPWDHNLCNAEGISRPPVEDKVKQVYFCPECNQSLSLPGSEISYDFDDFVNKPCMIQVGTKKAFRGDGDVNEVKTVKPIS